MATNLIHMSELPLTGEQSTSLAPSAGANQPLTGDEYVYAYNAAGGEEDDSKTQLSTILGGDESIFANTDTPKKTTQTGAVDELSAFDVPVRQNVTGARKKSWWISFGNFVSSIFGYPRLTTLLPNSAVNKPTSDSAPAPKRFQAVAGGSDVDGYVTSGNSFQVEDILEAAGGPRVIAIQNAHITSATTPPAATQGYLTTRVKTPDGQGKVWGGLTIFTCNITSSLTDAWNTGPYNVWIRGGLKSGMMILLCNGTNGTGTENGDRSLLQETETGDQSLCFNFLTSSESGNAARFYVPKGRAKLIVIVDENDSSTDYEPTVPQAVLYGDEQGSVLRKAYGIQGTSSQGGLSQWGAVGKFGISGTSSMIEGGAFMNTALDRVYSFMCSVLYLIDTTLGNWRLHLVAPDASRGETDIALKLEKIGSSGSSTPVKRLVMQEQITDNAVGFADAADIFTPIIPNGADGCTIRTQTYVGRDHMVTMGLYINLHYPAEGTPTPDYSFAVSIGTLAYAGLFPADFDRLNYRVGSVLGGRWYDDSSQIYKSPEPWRVTLDANTGALLIANRKFGVIELPQTITLYGQITYKAKSTGALPELTY
jgi:hypothetical protein